MKDKFTNCKVCNQEIAKKAKMCPNCGAKIKKPFFKKWWFWAVIIVILFILGSGDSEGSTNNQSNPNSDVSVIEHENHPATELEVTLDTESIEQPTANTDDAENENEEQTEEPMEENAAEIKTEYCVGDSLIDGDTKIVYMSSGDYVEDNEYLQPEDGKKYIYLQFAFENISDKSDISISFYSFNCFADGYAMDMYYGGDEDLSATLSAGRATTGYVYFEVPVDAAEIEVEYETNIFTNSRIKFIFEGDKDSGYVQERNITPSDEAHGVGDVVESSKLIITYLSCEEYESDNMFVLPANGYRFVSCEFEFENLDASDEFVSSYDFDCYADGINCNQTFIRDDDLSATLSSGRKAKGTVTFEVPVDATVIEVEYLSNYWTSNRVVFTVQ